MYCILPLTIHQGLLFFVIIKLAFCGVASYPKCQALIFRIICYVLFIYCFRRRSVQGDDRNASFSLLLIFLTNFNTYFIML